MRKITTLSACPDPVAEVGPSGVELSEPPMRDARQRGWAEENREGFAAYDRFVETNGVFSRGRRLF